MAHPQIEIRVTQYHVEILYKGKILIELGIDAKREPIGAAPGLDMVKWDETLASRLPIPLEVVVDARSSTEMNPMGLPKRHQFIPTERHAIKPYFPSESAELVTIDHIDPHARDQVRDAILDHLIGNPNATKAEIAAETNRIAQIYDKGKYQVAGVRAALTRGAYGNLEELMEERINYLRRHVGNA